jgi:hypothetical protein
MAHKINDRTLIQAIIVMGILSAALAKKGGVFGAEPRVAPDPLLLGLRQAGVV